MKPFTILLCIIPVVMMLNTYKIFGQATTNTFPDTGSAGIGTITPATSALLEIESTSQGILIPRMTKTQRDAIVSPATGLLIYQTNSTPGFYYYSGASWVPVSAKGVNVSLSNLSNSGTSINQSLNPEASGTLDLGSSAYRWNDGYINQIKFNDGTAQASACIPYTAGAGIEITGSTILNTAPDQLVTLTGSGATTVSGSYPDFIISSENTWGINYIAGAGISINDSTIENTAPDQWVTLNNGTGIEITGTYPDFIINNTGDISATDEANNSLSNLTFTSVNQALLPDTSFSHNLGDSIFSWKDLFLDGSVYMKKTKVFSIVDTGNTFTGIIENYTNTGSHNTFTGYHAGLSNTTGHHNVANGTDALYANTSGFYNTAIGVSALSYNTTGYENTATGYQSLYSNTTGYENASYGYKNLLNNTTGYWNTSSGYRTMLSNTTGYENTASGYAALYFNTTGAGNTTSGSRSLYFNTTGFGNVASGHESLLSNTTGSYNVAVGNSAGSYNNKNNLCVFIGYDADQTVNTDFTNSMAFGYNSRITADNQVVIGNSTVASIGGYQNWTNISDGRYKKNVQENVPGLEFINKLRPVTYTLDINGILSFIGEDKSDAGEEGQLKTVTPDEKIKSSIAEKEKIIYTGFIAQEVEKTAREAGYDFSGVDSPENENTLYGLRYAEFVVPLTKAVQELDKNANVQKSKLENVQMENANILSTVDMHQAEINILKNELAELKNLMNDLIANQSPANSQTILAEQKTTTHISIGDGWLEQNIPNPFSVSTIIRCFIPETFSSAALIITAMNGTILKNIKLHEPGLNEIIADVSTISENSYQYALIIDGKIIDTKQMVGTK